MNLLAVPLSTIIAMAIAPGIIICFYIFYRDKYNREPTVNLVVSFLFGCLAILPALFFEDGFSKVNDATTSGTAIFAYCIVGFSEETSKFLGLRFYSYRQKSFDEPFDGIVYAVMVSMGFATVENVMYGITYHDPKIQLIRMFLSVPGHATFAIIMGYFVGKAKFNSKNSFTLMLTGLIGAIFFHGTFDFFLFENGNQSAMNQDTSAAFLALGALTSFIVSLFLCRKLIRRQRTISQEMFKAKNTNTSV